MTSRSKIVLTIYIAVDIDGTKSGWGPTATAARNNAYQEGIATARSLLGPFRRRKNPKHIEEFGPTTWTDGDCTLDCPEAYRAWADKLDCSKITIESISEQKGALVLAAIMDTYPKTARRIAKTLPKEVADA